jgi:excisionase family DNA binding protein
MWLKSIDLHWFSWAVVQLDLKLCYFAPRWSLEEILARYLTKPEVGLISAKTKPMGLTVKQAAEELGVCPETIYRLLKRGMLRSSSALRHKVIPRSEIERFLKDTTHSSH